MNKKAQSSGIGIAIIIAIFLFAVGMMSVNFVRDTITDSRIGLSCSAPTSDGVKLACLMIDTVLPYFIILVFAAAGGLITARLLL